jgi:hypothetical protein
MTINEISQGLLMMISPYFQNFGNEMGKELGKDVYKKIKTQLKGDQEKKAIEMLNHEPLSYEAKAFLKNHLVLQLSNDKLFYSDISQVFKTNFSDTFILSLILRTISEINEELPKLYTGWLKSGIEKKGAYQNRIDDLEDQLRLLEEKFFSIMQRNTMQNTIH